MNHRGTRIEELRRVPLLASLDDEGIADLAVGSRRGEYRAGEWIHGEGSMQVALFAIVRGSARVSRSSIGGNDVTIGTMPAGAIAGLPFATLDAASHSGLDALEDGTTVYRIPCDLFRRLLRRHPDLAYRVLEVVSRRFLLQCDRVAELASYTIPVRLARELVRAVEEGGNRRITATQTELAARIGARRDSTAEALRRVKERGWVESTQGRRGIAVLDVERLARYGEQGA